MEFQIKPKPVPERVITLTLSEFEARVMRSALGAVSSDDEKVRIVCQTFWEKSGVLAPYPEDQRIHVSGLIKISREED